MSSTKETIFPFKRAGGILLHPTSLPGDFGIGDFGNESLKFIDFLKENKFRVWQILPLGPTGYGNSPYQCFSAFAGNPYLISIDKVIQDYKLTEKVDRNLDFDATKVNYEKVISFKMAFLKKFFTNYFKKLSFKDNKDYLIFKDLNKDWLDEYALFMSIKSLFDQKSWTEWPENYKLRKSDAINSFREEHESDIEFHKFIQFLFFSQWKTIKDYANEKGITIIGDIPIYVALDSADVWSNQHLFYIENGIPIVVAGVPPDFFSKTGQLWGNPIYKWSLMKKNGFKWWIKRISQTLTLVDIIRLDHFRGFEAYWEVPGSDTTAENGKWIKAPGKELFTVLSKKFSPLPLIAEDLGVITTEVNELREKFSFPGMKILQMAFGDHKFVETRFLPHNIERNSVMYTGTHDNDPISAWWSNANEKTKLSVLNYFSRLEETIINDLIRAVWSSVAALAVIPMQDLLHKGRETRMNFPGTMSNNWEWRFEWKDIKDEYIKELRKFSTLYDR